MAANISNDLENDVSQRDRISIDVADIRQDIENCRQDAAWGELPLSAKIRVLVKERLEEMQRQKS